MYLTNWEWGGGEIKFLNIYLLNNKKLELEVELLHSVSTFGIDCLLFQNKLGKMAI